MAGVAGANIANATGRPDEAGDAISASVVQDPIGAYVQDADNPTANTNFIGVNVEVAYATNVLGELVDEAFTCEATQGAAAGELVQWVQAGEAIALDDDVALTDGVAAVDNSTGTHTCLVAAGAAAGEYFWALVI